MRENRTSSPPEPVRPGLDLHLELASARGRAEAVAAALRAAIADGRLPVGTALPSTRVLAADLGVARGTVTAAYTRLAEQGHLTVTQGAPTRVATPAPPGPRGRVPAPEERRTIDASLVALDDPQWDLRPGRPCGAMFPRADWVAATRTVMARAVPRDFDYPDVRGHLALRQAVARYVGRVRGVTADADRVVITPGFGAGLAALATALSDGGAHQMQFEDPSLPMFRAAVAECGVRVAGVPVDEQGLVVDAVTAPAVVTTPAHQFPWGMTLSPARRSALAARRDVVVVEDDYDGEFRFAAKPVGALQALAPDHIVYAGTASKALAPAVGLGWFVLPGGLVDPMAEVLRRRRLGAPALVQLVVADMLDSGRYDRQVRRARSVYRRRRHETLELLAALGLQAGGGPTAGLHVVARLPGHVRESDVLAGATRRGVGVGALSPLYFDAADAPPGLVVGYAAPAEHSFKPALAALAETLRGCLR